MSKSTTAVIMASSAAIMALAGTANAQSIRIEDTVARVVYVPEDRADIAVEISNESSAQPRLVVTRSGRDVTVRGDVERRTFRNLHCRMGGNQAPPERPGENASVTVQRLGTVNVSEAPLIFVRGPRGVKIETGGGVFGSIGRGATSLKLSNGGCGVWVVANIDGDSQINIGGQNNIWMGRTESLSVNIGGSGDVHANAVSDLRVSIGGSGDVEVQRVDGNVNIAIAGSGDVGIRGGDIGRMAASIAGSGNVEADTNVRDLSVTVMGSGDVSVRRVTGSLSKRIMGGGRVRVGD